MRWGYLIQFGINLRMHRVETRYGDTGLRRAFSRLRFQQKPPSSYWEISRAGNIRDKVVESGR
jgi:hypothetical protein